MPRRFHSQPLNRTGWRLPGRLRVVPAETALAHRGLIGEHRKRKIARQMLVDPVVEWSELVVGCLQGQCCAELGLSARTLKEDNQIAGDGERHGAAEVLLDERQRQINPGGHSSRGPY